MGAGGCVLRRTGWGERGGTGGPREAVVEGTTVVAMAGQRSRDGRVQAKGLGGDDTAVVGSLNWGDGGTTRNREVLLVVENAEVADFYARTYAADWRGGGVHLPVGLLAGLSATFGAAAVVTRREVAFA